LKIFTARVTYDLFTQVTMEEAAGPWRSYLFHPPFHHFSRRSVRKLLDTPSYEAYHWTKTFGGRRRE